MCTNKNDVLAEDSTNLDLIEQKLVPPIQDISSFGHILGLKYHFLVKWFFNSKNLGDVYLGRKYRLDFLYRQCLDLFVARGFS